MSNSTLAARISALVDKWNGYKNALRDMLTKSTGTVDMEDGTGAIVTLPTFPQLQQNVTALTDAATGAVAGAQAASSAATVQANAAAASAAAADGSMVAAQEAKDAALSSMNAAGTSAADAAASATTASTKATEAATSASGALTSENAASASATTASTKATAADTSATNAAASASEAQSWALTAQTTVTGLLRYAGSYDASTGVFPANPSKGDFWKISTAGTVGAVDLAVGDQIIYSGTGWDKIDNTESVTSVAGRVGNVTISISDLAGLRGELDAKAPLASPQFTGSVGIGGGDPAKLTTITSDTDLTFNHANGYATANMRWTFAGATKLLLNKLGDLTASGRVITQAAHFDSSTNAVVLGCAAGGMVYLRPNGPDNSAGQATLDSAGGFTNNGTLTVNCVSAADSFQVNNPGSSPAGSYVGISSPGGVPGLIGQYSTTKRRDIQFTNSGIQLAVSTGLGGAAPQFTFGENGGFTATGPIDASNISAGVLANGIVQRNASGYIMTGYINTTANVATAAPSHIAIQNSTDGYIRWQTPAQFRANMKTPQIFVQSADPGAAAADGDLWFW